MSFKESLLEVLWIVKTCLTTVWFWIPIIFALYTVIQLGLLFVHPLTLLIVPTILAIYAIRREKQRIQAEYNLPKTKRLKASHPIGTGPLLICEVQLEQKLEEYLRALEKTREIAN